MTRPHRPSLVVVEKYIWQDNQGFWFVDETEDFNGPFDTLDVAREQMKRYDAELNGEPL